VGEGGRGKGQRKTWFTKGRFREFEHGLPPFALAPFPSLNNDPSLRRGKRKEIKDKFK